MTAVSVECGISDAPEKKKGNKNVRLRLKL